MYKTTCIASALLVFCSLSVLGSAQTSAMPAIPPGGDIPKSFVPHAHQIPDYTKRELEIQMRDGVLLHTVILIPKGVNHGPMLLDRSPYSQNEVMSGGEGPFLSQSLAPLFADLAEGGYIIVVQDVRGKYGSGGEYVMNRPVRGPLNTTGIDNATDTWDTIDWLVKHVPESNGRVGTIGTSYEGFTVLMSLIDPHPA